MNYTLLILAILLFIVGVLLSWHSLLQFRRDVDFLANLGFKLNPTEITMVHASIWTGVVKAGVVRAEIVSWGTGAKR